MIARNAMTEAKTKYTVSNAVLKVYSWEDYEANLPSTVPILAAWNAPVQRCIQDGQILGLHAVVLNSRRQGYKSIIR
jgi:hypothetical protein